MKYCASSDGFEIEMCPHCGNEIKLRWDINKDGFKAFCPVCGRRLMLCDACAHRFGDHTDDCDYNSKTDTCRFNKGPKQVRITEAKNFLTVLQEHQDEDFYINGISIVKDLLQEIMDDEV